MTNKISSLMTDYSFQKKEENKDRLKSGLITAIIWSALLLFLFWYKVEQKLPEKKEVETRMLINFGDNTNGNGLEEPKNQQGSIAPEPKSMAEENPAQPAEKTIPAQSETVVAKPEKNVSREKIISGKNEKNSVKHAEDIKNKNKKTAEKPSNFNTKNSGSKPSTSKSKSAGVDAKGDAAIGNLLKGRGKQTGSQGTGNSAGNAGDPLGGEGNGDSKIGIDRKLVGYIPGTMGRGGKQPDHDCDAGGSITISYTVDKAGNVVSAHRSGGISDPCVVSTSISWVKKYVKAERANSSSTGSYKISF